MQGAWYVATGQTLSLSEQQLVDCSWQYGNNGCGGGEMEPAIQYVVDAGGAVTEEDYQYLGQNGYCGYARCGGSLLAKGVLKSTLHSKGHCTYVRILTS